MDSSLLCPFQLGFWLFIFLLFHNSLFLYFHLLFLLFDDLLLFWLSVDYGLALGLLKLL
jgi:hypothetical protein